jgi:hypothetical protein
MTLFSAFLARNLSTHTHIHAYFVMGIRYILCTFYKYTYMNTCMHVLFMDMLGHFYGPFYIIKTKYKHAIPPPNLKTIRKKFNGRHELTIIGC